MILYSLLIRFNNNFIRIFFVGSFIFEFIRSLTFDYIEEEQIEDNVYIALLIE